MDIRDLNQGNIEATIEGHDMVVIDFWAPWCKHCEGFDQAFSAAAAEYPQILFGRVNIAEEKELKAAFQVKSVPTLAIYREQIMVGFQPGMLPPDVFKRMIDKVEALDMDRLREEIAAEETQEGGTNR